MSRAITIKLELSHNIYGEFHVAIENKLISHE
jgi:hypothetical protein